MVGFDREESNRELGIMVMIRDDVRPQMMEKDKIIEPGKVIRLTMRLGE